MNFYKIIIFIAIIVLIIFLSIVAISIYNSKKDAIFPPHISICPDYYIYNEETQKCTTKKFNFENQDDYNLCNEIDFFNTDNDTDPPICQVSGCEPADQDDDTSNYQTPGMGPDSGICQKKRWAIDCGVNWDGITNNNDVCYMINK